MTERHERDGVYVTHMLDCISRIFEYSEKNELLFRSSKLIQDAVVRNLQTMAESSQRLGESTRALAPEVPWRAISGFRNILVHDYLGLDLDAIWAVVATQLEPLKIGLEKIKSQLVY